VADVLVIESDAPLAFFDVERPSDVDRTYGRLSAVSELSSELRIDGGATPACRVDLDNGDGRLTAVLANAPLRQNAILRRDGTEVFRGLVASVEIGVTCMIEIQA